MNRKQRLAAKQLTAQAEARVVAHAMDNAFHWGEVRRLKREYDAMSDEQKAERKPEMAAAIDQHLAALAA